MIILINKIQTILPFSTTIENSIQLCWNQSKNLMYCTSTPKLLCINLTYMKKLLCLVCSQQGKAFISIANNYNLATLLL